MKTITRFQNLVNHCEARGIVCERVKKHIELTTPCGGTTAEVTTILDAWDTVTQDSTFCDLPLTNKQT